MRYTTIDDARITSELLSIEAEMFPTPELQQLRIEVGQLRFASDLVIESETALRQAVAAAKARESEYAKWLDGACDARDAALRSAEKWRGRFAMAVMIPAVVILAAAWGWAWRWISQ